MPIDTAYLTILTASVAHQLAISTAAINMTSNPSKLASFSSEISDLCASISNLSKSERKLGSENNDQLHGALQDMVHAITSIWTTLKAIEAPPTGDAGEDLDDSLVLDEDGNDVALIPVQKDVAELVRSVEVLTTQTKKGRDEAADLKGQSIELSSKAKSLNARIAQVKKDMEGELEVKNKSLNRTINSYNQRVNEYNEAVEELNELEEELEDRKDNRALLRAGRVAAWGTSLFLPGLAPIALGMEYAAKKLGDKIDAAKSRKSGCESEMRSAQSGMDSLKSEVSNLRSTVSRVRALLDNCECQVNQSEYILERCSDSVDRLHKLDSAANHLVNKLRSIEDKAIDMKNFSDDRRILQEAAGDFIDEVIHVGQGDLMDICEPLLQLLE